MVSIVRILLKENVLLRVPFTNRSECLNGVFIADKMIDKDECNREFRMMIEL